MWKSITDRCAGTNLKLVTSVLAFDYLCQHHIDPIPCAGWCTVSSGGSPGIFSSLPVGRGWACGGNDFIESWNHRIPA